MKVMLLTGELRALHRQGLRGVHEGVFSTKPPVPCPAPIPVSDLSPEIASVQGAGPPCDARPGAYVAAEGCHLSNTECHSGSARMGSGMPSLSAPLYTDLC